jgi:hypothetical protein
MADDKPGVDVINGMVNWPTLGWGLLCHTLEVLPWLFPLGVSERLAMTVGPGLRRPRAGLRRDALG